ncbi:MAG: alpha-amylase family glycosyl hydrolase [Oscillospiraceae bacterium]|nr:alpha-amylase family glycosyl hydrolase [Oscillospiraceae bacterium]
MKKLIGYAAILLALLFLSGCAPSRTEIPPNTSSRRDFYEIFVGSFCDSDGDGLGDLQGLISKLDYLNNPRGRDTLGVSGIWLMPINPSPTYHKYDVTDYYAVDPGYGTMEDFERLIAEARERGIDVIIDLVINHTSSKHPWFLAALEELRSGSEPRYQLYYNFTDERVGADYYPAPGGKFYEAHFWNEMPDLNMDNEALRGEILNIARFWLEKGVAGFRLDAARHVYNSQARNLEFWTWFVDACRDIKEDIFLVGEVWSGESEILPFYETGLAVFNFPFAGHDGTINRSLNSGNGGRLASELERWDREIRLRNPDGINCLFLSNHDTGRSAGFIPDPNRRKLAAAVYLLVPGSPFIYYGEEIGMTGSGIDENKRTAMLWSASDPTGIPRNPAGAEQVRAPAQGVAEQLADRNSLLNYYRAVLALKARHPSLYDGEVVKIDLENQGLCAFRAGDAIVVHNLTGESAAVALGDLGGVALGGSVSPTGASVSVKNGVLTLPPYASAILT